MTILKVPKEDRWFPEKEVLSIIRKVMKEGVKPDRESLWYTKDARHHVHKALRHILHYIDSVDAEVPRDISKEDYLALALTRLMMANVLDKHLI